MSGKEKFTSRIIIRSSERIDVTLLVAAVQQFGTVISVSSDEDYEY